MNRCSTPISTQAERLTATRVKERFQQNAPGYGAEFSSEEWERIADRLRRLVQLLWKMSVRQVQKDEKTAEGSHPSGEVPAP